MAEIRHLRNAPIAEALLDFRFNVPEGVGKSELDQLVVALSDEFPTKEVRYTFQGTFATDGSVPPSAGFTKSTDGFVLRSADRRKAVIVKRNGLTLSHVSSYTQWENLLGDSRVAFDRFCAVISPQGINRIGARFINRIPLAKEKIDLDQLLTRPPQTPVGVSDLIDIYRCQIGIVDEEAGLRAILNQGIIDVADGRAVLIDSDVYRVGTFEAHFGSLEPVLDAIRSLKNRIFFGSLTEKALEPFI